MDLPCPFTAGFARSRDGSGERQNAVSTPCNCTPLITTSPLNLRVASGGAAPRGPAAAARWAEREVVRWRDPKRNRAATSTAGGGGAVRRRGSERTAEFSMAVAPEPRQHEAAAAASGGCEGDERQWRKLVLVSAVECVATVPVKDVAIRFDELQVAVSGNERRQMACRWAREEVPPDGERAVGAGCGAGTGSAPRQRDTAAARSHGQEARAASAATPV